MHTGAQLASTSRYNLALKELDPWIRKTEEFRRGRTLMLYFISVFHTLNVQGKERVGAFWFKPFM